MKVSTAIAVLTATAVTASNLAHQHQHFHNIKKRTQVTTSWVEGPTAYAFVLDGKPISVEQVCEGIKDNELTFKDAVAPAGLCSSTTTSAGTTASTTTGGKSAAAFYQATSSAAANSGSGGWSSWSGSGNGVDRDFPDGQLDCSTFPSAYGAVSLDYLGMQGWSGLQAVTWGVNAITGIVTGISGQSCTEGMMCSYACPPGYQKSQWPSTQGATGQSVGGIQCKNGKLFLTNPGMSSKLCMQGVGGVQATNNAGGVVAICRTDYPGTESETIPVELQPGSTNQLACPDAANYYNWQGKSTSAQYYLNPIGVAAKDACQWGSAGSNQGNWAPINFGVGYKDGKTWLSIFQNKPTTYNSYSGTVEIQGDLSASCKYSNGQYCGATGCNQDGCTVSFPPNIFLLTVC